MRIRQHIGNVDIQLNTDRLDCNVKEAQIALNEQIAVDCDPYIPFQQGALAGSVHYPKGIAGGEIAWGGTAYDVPYAHYQYEGIVYGPNIPEYDDSGNIIGYWSPPNKKPTGRKLQYHPKGTERGDHWFEKAKEQHKDDWLKLVKRTAGKE